MITYRKDLDLTSMVDDIAKRIQDEVDQQALDKAATTLAKFGYEKVVRCMDCKHYHPDENTLMRCRFKIEGFVQWRNAEPNGFCAWAEKRDD